MKAIGLLFILCHISFLDSCLVVKGCPCPYMELDRSNIDAVSDYPFYSNVSRYSLSKPVVRWNNDCPRSMECYYDNRDQMLLMDKATTYPLTHGFNHQPTCDSKTKRWSINLEEGGTASLERLNGVCVNYKECGCTLIGMDRSTITNYVSRYSTFNEVRSHPLYAPYIGWGSCKNVQIRCDPDYDLTLFYNYSLTVTLGFIAYGQCSGLSQELIIKDDGSGSTISMKNVYAVCVDNTAKDLCTPEDKSSFLLAYSNDLSIGEFNGLLNYLKETFPKEKISPQFKTFQQVRFDANTNTGILYSTDIDEWFSILEKNPPNPSEALKESNIIGLLRNNTATCGSKIFVLMKRPLPDTKPYADLLDQIAVENLQRLRNTLFTISPVLEGSRNLGARMAARTDGYGIFTNDPYPDALANIPLLGPYYCVYSFNIRLTGNRQPFKLYDLKIQKTGVYTLMIISDIKLEGTNYFELEYSLDDSDFKGTLDSSVDNGNGNIIWKELTLYAGTYLFMLNNDLPGYQDYYAANTRVYSKEPVNYWVP